MNKKKQPVAKQIAAKKGPRIAVDPDSSNTMHPVWQFGLVACDGCWAFSGLPADIWWNEVFPKLRNFETMTWHEIESATGGKSRGTNSHFVNIEDLCKDARKLIERDQRLSDLDQLFSLRLTSKMRIWGKREGRVLKILWYDPNHEICPSIT